MTREFGAIDEILGARGERFFAEGFREANHGLGELEIGVRHHHGFIRGRASVSYGAGRTGRTVASVSSIDALVLAVQLCEIYLATRFGLGASERQRMWIRNFVVKSDSPSPVTTPLAASAVHLNTRFESRSLCGNVSILSCIIGSVSVRLEIEHEIAELRRTAGFLPGAEHVLGAPGTRYYGERYKRGLQTLERVQVDEALLSATALVRLGVEEDEGPLSGLQGLYLPALTYIDAIVVGAELAQALFTVLKETPEPALAPLWIRSVSASSKTPHLDHVPFLARARIENRRGLTLQRGRWRVDEVAVELHGIKARFSFAHAVRGPQRPEAAAA